MSSKLASIVFSRFGGELTQEEARQLIFFMFSTVDWLPDSLSTERWDRAALSREFSTLAKEGFIRDISVAQGESIYWSTVIDQFMLGRLKVDHHLCARFCEKK